MASPAVLGTLCCCPSLSPSSSPSVLPPPSPRGLGPVLAPWEVTVCSSVSLCFQSPGAWLGVWGWSWGEAGVRVSQCLLPPPHTSATPAPCVRLQQELLGAVAVDVHLTTSVGEVQELSCSPPQPWHPSAAGRVMDIAQSWSPLN